MEYRLVLNIKSGDDISNRTLSGELNQKLKYYKFRRVPSKLGKPVFYLFFKREQDTYHALRVAKSISEISLVRYRHKDVTDLPLRRSDDLSPSEAYYRLTPPQNIINLIRYNYSKYFDRFRTKDVFKLFVRRTSEQIVAQRLSISEVNDRICKLNHWWWMNKEYSVADNQSVQKLLDIFFT